MKQILRLSFLSFLVLLFTCSQAQETKTKQKAHKTKIKSTVSVDSTSGASLQNSNTASSNQLANTSWQTFIGDPVNDTVIIHYAVDSSDVRSKSSGQIMIKSVYAVNQDTVTFHDVDGDHACPSDQVGKYRLVMNGDMLKFDLVEDGCDGRAAVLKELTWQKLK